jgi:hypothetical protein
MAVYVDQTWRHGRTPNMPYPESCHMMADTKAELLEFAQRLGLRTRWLHKDHFDIVPSKRVLAMSGGVRCLCQVMVQVRMFTTRCVSLDASESSGKRSSASAE